MRTLITAIASVSLFYVATALAQQEAQPENRTAEPPPPATAPAQPPHPAPPTAAQPTLPLAQSKPAQQKPLISTQSLVGTTVKNTQGEKLGTIEELMIDPQSGRVQYAVLASGGILGMGSERLSLPWETLKMGLGEEELVVEVDKSQLTQAPSTGETSAGAP